MPTAPTQHTPKAPATLTHKSSHQQQKAAHDSRHYDYTWRQLRRSFLNSNPLCVMCLAEDRVQPAEHVDHIVPITRDATRRLDVTNLRALCQPHHSQVTRNYVTTGVNQLPGATP